MVSHGGGGVERGGSTVSCKEVDLLSVQVLSRGRRGSDHVRGRRASLFGGGWSGGALRGACGGTVRLGPSRPSWFGARCPRPCSGRRPPSRLHRAAPLLGEACPPQAARAVLLVRCPRHPVPPPSPGPRMGC